MDYGCLEFGLREWAGWIQCRSGNAGVGWEKGKRKSRGKTERAVIHEDRMIKLRGSAMHMILSLGDWR